MFHLFFFVRLSCAGSLKLLLLLCQPAEGNPSYLWSFKLTFFLLKSTRLKPVELVLQLLQIFTQHLNLIRLATFLTLSLDQHGYGLGSDFNNTGVVAFTDHPLDKIIPGLQLGFTLPTLLFLSFTFRFAFLPLFLSIPLFLFKFLPFKHFGKGEVKRNTILGNI